MRGTPEESYSLSIASAISLRPYESQQALLNPGSASPLVSLIASAGCAAAPTLRDFVASQTTAAALPLFCVSAQESC